MDDRLLAAGGGGDLAGAGALRNGAACPATDDRMPRRRNLQDGRQGPCGAALLVGDVVRSLYEGAGGGARTDSATLRGRRFPFSGRGGERTPRDGGEKGEAAGGARPALSDRPRSLRPHRRADGRRPSAAARSDRSPRDRAPARDRLYARAPRRGGGADQSVAERVKEHLKDRTS